jgi:hypothetical protein
MTLDALSNIIGRLTAKPHWSDGNVARGRESPI